MSIFNIIPAPIRTNENGARTKSLIAVGITVAVVAAGIYFTKKNVPTPVIFVVEEAAETIADAATKS